MDVILSACDTLALDRVWANLFPIQSLDFKSVLNSDIPVTYTANSTYVSGTRISSAIIGTMYDAAVWLDEYTGLAPSKYAELSSFPRDDWRRQFVSIFFIVWVFGIILYFLTATISYVFVFDKTTFKHPKFLKNQIRLEMEQSLTSMPGMSFLTTPFFVLEVRGLTRLYDNPFDYGKFYFYFQFPLFILFTDGLIYLIHRGLHHPLIYKHLHKAHHKWIMPTPYASHAFHPVDGWAQSLPYHLFPLVLPLWKFASVALFIFVNVWTVLIHDGNYVSNSAIINGAACHTMHHLYFNFNYGQFTTFWDRLGGSYRKPNDELFNKQTKMSKEEWERQKKEMEVIVQEVEGDDSERVYIGSMQSETKKSK